MSDRIVHEFSYHVPCGHYTVTATGEPVTAENAGTGNWFNSVAQILGPCRACQPQKVERLKKRKVPYDKLP